FNTEPRIASYIGIALGQIPPEHYFGGWRTFPDTCDWSWPETKPIGEWRSYLGVDVFEGAYPYSDKLVVPTWGGSMFEALMPTLVVPEEQWGPDSWAVTHPLYVEAHIEYGLEEAQYGYWGFSPASNPAGGYREYGVDAIGMEPNGYTSDVDRLTLVDNGWDDPACPREPTPISDYGQGVVTPHAAFLALDFAPDETLANLANLAADFPGLYGKGGFKDSVNVATGQIADRYLALDQGMVIAAAANALLNDQLQGYLAETLEPSLRPLMEIEEFGAGRVE
ncbi:MAG TPA: glucoamylase family protein, partial [Jiangellaceae bacterium]|nr:glucoamylase family protein [Jiangellaceae bacterium]